MRFSRNIRKVWWNSEGTSPNFWRKKLPIREGLTKMSYRVLNNPLSSLMLDIVVPGSLILDAGCGPMIWANAFSIKDAEYIGLDYSMSLLQRGNKFNELGKKLKTTVGDVQALPFSDNSIDMYISLGIMEHFEEGMEPSLNECQRILKSCGVACISVPYLNWIRAILLPFDFFVLKLKEWNFLRTILGKKPIRPKNFYQFAYSVIELRNLIFKSGMCVEIIQPHAWDFGLTRDYKWFRLLKRRKPELFNIIMNVFRSISPFFCAHMVMIVARKPQ